MQETARKILYEDEQILVDCHLLETEKLVFSFSLFTEAGQPHRPFGDKFLLNNGFSGIWFTAKRGHWWQLPAMPDIVARAAEAAQGYAKKTSYGSSMGGYGALLFARGLGADRVVAVAPQTSITSDEVTLDDRWINELAHFPTLFDRVGDALAEGPADRMPRIDILYDSVFQRDVTHVRLLERQVPVTRYLSPFSGHKVLRHLKEIGLLKSLQKDILNDTCSPVDYRRALRAARRKDSLYLESLNQVLVQRANRTAKAGAELIQ